MEPNIPLLAGTAVTIGTLHTLAGPDHYLPFVALSRSRGWSIVKTVNIVIICGLGHVLSSIAIGFIGIAAGIALSGLRQAEGIRGNIAAWILFSFGLAYLFWGIFRLWRKRPHSHQHDADGKKKLTFWILFLVFIFGPCEPLIPVLMYPAAQHNFGTVVLISLLFAVTTIATMILVVLFLIKGIDFLKFNVLDKYQHVISGGTIALCGAAIVFLGL